MCAILQVFSRNKPVDRERFAAALQCMKHRGPDATGAHYHPEPIPTEGGGEVHVASGHQRLSILDLDPRSNQPFVRGRCSLVFNGEIYNFRELRAGLGTEVPFATTGDTEVLFHGLSRQGLGFLSRANGMWAFSHVDEANRLVLASRDRHGKKPLFYYEDEQQVVFASTLLAIHRYLGAKPRLVPEFVDSYLIHGAAFPGPAEQTHFSGIRQVPPGCSLRFDVARWTLKLERYFDLAAEARSAVPPDADLPALMKDAVQARLVSDRRVGLLLSGGIDSTIILSTLHALGLQEQVHCFIGETGRSEDAAYAQRCVEHLGIKATVVNLEYGKRTLERVLAMCLHHEKPFPFLGSSIAMSEMFEHVSAHDVRVVLDGTGGDEFFGGYWERYFPAAVRDALRHGDWTWLRESWRHARGERSLMVQGAVQLLTGGRLGGSGLRDLRKRWAPVNFTLGLPNRSLPSTDPLAALHAGFTDTLVRDASPGGQLGEWIWHNDRNSMMWGIEGRSPLLDHRLVRYMGSGYGTKFRREWNKFQLRQLYDALTPLPTQWRQQKQGFRWNRKAFLRDNAKAIFEIIGDSGYLRSRFNVGAFLDRARKSKRLLVSGVTPRLLCLAGMDAQLGMDAG